MNRDCYQYLQRWRKAADRKPLILRGARQVGKTHLLKSFAEKEYEKYLYLNFEEKKSVKAYFQGDLDSKSIIEKLELYAGFKISENDTLIIFDEVQACPEALNSLKYFSEQAPHIHIAAAGSLLGTKLANTQGFPVGKVNFLDLYPMTFFEFLNATGNTHLRTYLENITRIEPLDDPIHLKLLDLLKKYFFIGGLPDAVLKYINTGSILDVRSVHSEILNAYALDFANHVPKEQLMKVTAVWNTIPKQLMGENKKFKYADVKKSARAREYEDSIQWLIDANLLLRCDNVQTPKLPLSVYVNENAFKAYLVDIGLLGALSDLSPKIILEGNQLFSEFKGAITENYVAQALTAANHRNLYYWTNQSKAEVDFIFPHDMSILPLEVKSDYSRIKKSLQIYQNTYNPPVAVRTSPRNLKQDGNFYNLPLYLISRFSELCQI